MKLWPGLKKVLLLVAATLNIWIAYMAIHDDDAFFNAAIVAALIIAGTLWVELVRERH